MLLTSGWECFVPSIRQSREISGVAMLINCFPGNAVRLGGRESVLYGRANFKNVLERMSRAYLASEKGALLFGK